MTIWRAKIAAKAVLSRLPVRHETWRKVGIFRLGFMASPGYAMAAFARNANRLRGPADDPDSDWIRIEEPGPRAGSNRPDLEGARVLELGPGERLFSAVLARAAGASSIVFVDSGDFAGRALAPYQEMVERIAKEWGVRVDLGHARSLEDVLELCRADYLTGGVESLRSLESGSIDIAWSHAMLEHVREVELFPLLCELRRVMSHDGVMSHQVDLKDHLDYSLNNLRFSRRVWESRLMADSGFYTNRVGFDRMMELFRDAGFAVEHVRVERWDHLPIPRDRMAPEFRSRSERDLLVQGFDVVLRPV